MRVKIETACFWGEGEERKGYGAGSVIDVPEEVQALNEWMKPTEEALNRVPYGEEAGQSGESSESGKSDASAPETSKTAATARTSKTDQ